ncbi:N-6 DNA methylase [Aeromicrobium sp.]|uniref:N-6 DNA methylase n=1 Tax=Aeromicrobium sp. TaxID=1871063 RepID=UPI0030BD6853
MPDTAPQWLSDLVSEFGARAKTLLAGPGEREATIRPPLDHMVTKIGEHFGLTVVMHSEVPDTERHVRPDYGVQVNGAITGYVEVKAPRVSVDPDSFRGRNLEQWERLSDLPNLIYTNGTQWRLFRDAEPVGDPVILSGGPLESAGASLTVGPDFEPLLRQFFDWEPAPIRTVPKLVTAVAPLTRLLRGDVVERLEAERKAVAGGARVEDQQFSGLANDWRRLLFPEATDEKFADGYAQTVTFALLLATSDGVSLADTNLHGVGDAMKARHSLMGRALQLLTDEMAEDFRISLELLTRVVGAIDWDRIRSSPRDTYLYLYEQFLEAYDPKLRQQSGSYYTPLPVVEQMVRLTGDVLAQVLGRVSGFSDPNVTVVDPAMGTGTYLHAIIEQASEQVRLNDGQGAVAGRVTDLAKRLIGFELQTGPYAVAELRTSDMLRRIGATPPPGGMRTYVTNTLDDPHTDVDQLSYQYRAISDSRRLANEVKANTPVTVVIGNPPYRERACSAPKFWSSACESCWLIRSGWGTAIGWSRLVQAQRW